MDIVDVLRIAKDVVIIVVGIGTIIGFIIGWRMHWTKPIMKMAKTFNAFTSEILPSLLEYFEKKDLAPKDTLINWTRLISSDSFSVSSPKQLNAFGQKLLEESGMKEIIDNNIDKFLEKLKKEGPQISQDVENLSFYVIKEIENTETDVPLRNYIYNNSDMNMHSIIFVGSIYLRDKYFEKHPKLFEKS